MSRKPDVKKMEYFLEFTLEAQLNIDEETNHYKADEDSSDPHVFSSKHEQKMKEIFKLAEKKERMYRRKRRPCPFKGSCECGAVGRLSEHLPGASRKNPLTGVEQATG